MFPIMTTNVSNDPFENSVAPSPTPSMISETSTTSDSEWSTDGSFNFESSSSSPGLESPFMDSPLPIIPSLAGRTVMNDPFAFPSTGPQFMPGFDPAVIAFLNTADPAFISQLVQAFPCEAPKPSRRYKTSTPRPPNAFMLFRSDLLKSGRIPPGVEHRQQNISRVAGECWNMMPKDEKEKWFQKARDALEEHKRVYPEYKFSPTRKTPRKSRASAHAAADDKDHIRKLREKWTGIIGPAVPPLRTRKSRARHAHRVIASSMGSPTPSTPSSPPCLASSSSSMSLGIISSPELSLSPCDLTSSFLSAMSPTVSQSHPNRPRRRQSASASLTLKERDTLSGEFQDDEPTPTAFSFGHIPMPPTQDEVSPYHNLITSSYAGSSPSLGSLEPLPQLSLQMPCDGQSQNFSPDFFFGTNLADAPSGVDPSAFDPYGNMIADSGSFLFENTLPDVYFVQTPAPFTPY